MPGFSKSLTKLVVDTRAVVEWSISPRNTMPRVGLRRLSLVSYFNSPNWMNSVLLSAIPVPMRSGSTLLNSLRLNSNPPAPLQVRENWCLTRVSPQR